MYRDCLANVRPKLELYKNLEQAKEAIENLKEKLYPQLKELTAQQQLDTEDTNSLHPIPEDSEFDDGVRIATTYYNIHNEYSPFNRFYF